MKRFFTVETPSAKNDRLKAKRYVAPSRLLCFQIVHLPVE